MSSTTVATLEATTIEAIEELLDSCLAAKEAYEIAIRGIEGRHESAAIALRVLESDHAENVHKVQKMAIAHGADVSRTNVRPLTRVVEGVVSMFGDAATLRALEPVERRCLDAARKAADVLDGDAQSILRNSIVPRLEKHAQLVRTLVENA
jgi:hypothetical protein